MNRIYRLVYNRTLGVWQVASELVKAARGGRNSSAGLSMAALHPVSFGLWLALGWVGLAQPVTAQQTPGAQAGRIIADPGAPERQRPTVVTSSNGTPLVNITTPSAAGVSRNTYSQFDVGSEGAILNNSRGNVQTQLGGWVQGNPWLGKGTARVILNEVNSANPSQLHGYVEVAGDRAQVVIANPAGISVDGGGFLNASRVTLTTGTAIVNGGVLDGYRVDGGAVRISGAGLDASDADYTDIISRSLEVNAGIWAKQLQASLGSNVANADHTQVSAQAASGSAPMFALDVSALGGMYANKIWLVGNEHGVGMRNAGKIGAQAGELVVQADGRLENLGTLQSQLDTRLSVTGGLANSGTVSAGNEVKLATQADLDNSGGTLNARRIEVEAASLRNAGGAIEQTGVQALMLQAGNVINRNDGRIGLQSSSSEPGDGGGTQPGGSTGGTGGTGGGGTGENGGGTGTGGTGGTPQPTLEAGALRIAGALDNSGGRINAGGQMRLSAESGLDNAGGQLGLQRLALNGGDLDNSDGHIVVSDQASIHAGSVSNDRGRLEIANQFDFQAERLSNRDGKLTHTGAASTVLSVAGELDNEGGALLSKAGFFTIDAAQLINRDGRIEHAGSQALKVTVDQLQGQKGVIATAAALELRGGAVDNREATISAELALLQLDSLDNRGGSVVANGNGSSSIEVAGSLDNGDEGLLASDGDLSVSAKTLGNEKGRIQHAGEGVLTVAAETLNGKGGNIIGNGTLMLTGEHTDLSEGTTAAKKISIDTGNLSTAGGKLIASGDGALDIAARQALNNAGGVLATNGVLSLSAAQLDNQSGTIQAAGTGKSNLQIAGALDNSGGSVVAAGNTTINAASVLNSGGTVQAAGASTLQITADGLLDNSEQGLLASGGDLSISAETLDNQSGRIEHAGDGALTIAAETLNGKGGSIIGNGALSLTGEDTDLSDGTTTGKKISIDTGNLSTAGGKLVASGSEVLDIAARHALNNAGGMLATNGALSLTAAQLNNQAGEIQAAGAGNSRLQVNGTLDNSGGTVAAAGNTAITAVELLNADGTVQAVGSSTLQVAVDGLLDNSNEGLLASGGDLTVSAQTLENEQGRIEHAGDGALTIAAETLNGKGGSIIGNGALTLTGERTDLSEGITAARKVSIDTGNLSIAGGKLIASGDEVLDITARQALNNTDGTVATNGALSLSAAQLDNRDGTIQAAGAGNSKLQVGSMLDNSGGTVAAAGNTAITAADLLNVGGTVQAAGVSTLQLTVDGLLDNSDEGLLASGGDLIVSAQILGNEKGRIEHAGDGELAIATETLSGKGGSIIGNGTLTLSGENTDLSEGTTTAKRINVDTGNLSTAGGTLIASGGDALELSVRQTLDNAGGTVASNGALALAAAQLNNQDGTIQAAGTGETHIDVANTLNNSGGTVAAAGNTTITAANLLNVGGTVQAAGTSTLQVSVDGLLDNSEEGLLTSGGDLSIGAETLDNQSGRIEHVGGGALTIAAETLNGKGGSIISNGALALTGEEADLSKGTTSARKISIDTGNLSTAGGKLIASSDEVLDISVRQTLNNAGGTVATNGALSLGAAQLNNQNGTIQAAGAGNSTLQVGGALDNNGGTIAAAGNTTFAAAELLNVGGTVQAAGSSTLQLTVDGLLDNSDEGLLAGGGDLTVNAQTLVNEEGRIEHAGDGALTIAAEALNGKGGSIIGNGTLTLTGEETDLSGGTTAAKKISIDVGNLSTAGGKLIASGDEVLDITVRQALNNAGGTVATNGALSLNTADLDNRDGTIQAAGTAATHVAVANTLDNSGGTLTAAGSTTVAAAELINVGGTVQAAGTSTLQVSVDGLLDNGDEGLLASGGDLTVNAQTLDNEKGRIEHAGDGTLLIAAENFNGKGGSIIGNGALTLSGENTDLSEGTTAARKISIDTGNLSTGGGKLIASGEEVLDISVRQTLNNAGGTVATNGALSLVAAQLNNLGGTIQAAGVGKSNLQVAGTLENSGGTVAAAGNTTLTAANLLNVGGTVQAAGASTLRVSVDSLLDNSDDGLLASGGDLTVSAQTLVNEEGRIEHAGDGALAIAAETLNGKGGSIIGNGTLTLTGEDTDLSDGITAANKISIATGTLSNAGGKLIASGDEVLDISVRQTLNNAGGTVATNGALSLAAATLNNQSGTVQAAGNGATHIDVAAALDNSGGTLAAAGNTTINAAELINVGGTVRAAGSSTLQVTVDGLLDNSAEGLLASGGDLTVSTQTLANEKGRIEHAGDGALTIAAGTLNGKGGSIIGNGALMLTGENTDLSEGTTAAKKISIDTGNLSTAGGKLIASGDEVLDITVRQSMNNAGGTVASSGALSLGAAQLNNRDGTIQAAGADSTKLQIGGSLDNSGGTVAAAGNTAITAAELLNVGGTVQVAGTSTLQVTVDGLLDNSEDGLLASGGDLTVSAQALKNEKGRIEHAGDGALTIAAETLNGKGGRIVGNGALTLIGENTDLSEGTTAARTISIDTGNLSTAGGKLIASGEEVLDISVRQMLNNAGGTLATNGALSLSAAQLNNQNGTVQAAGAGNSTLHVAGTLDSSGGTLAAAGNTTISAAELRNVDGTVQAAGSSTLQVTVDGLLDNSGEGLLASGGDLTISAKTLENQTGRIEHAGDGALTIAAETLNGKGGSIIGNGALTLTGENTDLSEGITAAGKINIDTGSLSTAAGKLIASGDEVLDISVRQTLNNAGGTVATNGALALGAAQLNNQNGTIQAAGAGNSILQVTGALDNSGGTVAAAGNTTINAAELINVGGTVQAAGSSTLQVTVDGLLDNSADGLLASGGDLTVDAQMLANESGRIEHAGDGALTIAAETLNGRGGSIIGNGTLTLTGEETDLSGGTTAAKKISIDTGNLSTAGGKLIASGNEVLDITVRQSMDNANGTVATNGALSLSAGELRNQSGAIQAAGTGGSTLRVTGPLDNSGGALATAGATSINAGSLLNNGGSIAASSSQKLELDVRQKLSNDAGSIVGNGEIQLRAENLSNRGGAIETQRSIDAVVSNTLDNSSGTLLAGQALSLQGNTLLNQKLAGAADGGILAGSNVVLRMDAVDNSHGRISATQGLDVVGRHLQNTAGVIDASGDLDITVADLDNSSGKLIQRNEDGELTLQVDGLLANAGGLIGAEGDASLSAASVDNVAGTVSTLGDLTFTSAGAINNQSGGLLQSGGATVLNTAGGLNNAGGQIDAAKAATITAAGVDNSGGSILAGTKGDQDSALLINAGSLLQNSAGTIASRGSDVTISAGTINNTGGTLVAERDIALHAGSVLNNAGTLYATRDLRYEGAQAQLDNGNGRFGAGGTAYLTLASANNAAGGRIQAGTLWLAVPGFVNNGDVGADVLHVNLTGAFAGTGSMFATQWLDARYDGDFTYTSQQLKSDGRLDLTVSGNFTNMGGLHSAGELNVTAKDVTNHGSIVASNQAGTGVARIDASGTLDNRDGASIEADNLHLSANDVINTGDISGDTVLIEANTLVNGRDLGQAMAVRNYGEGFIGAVDHLELRVARQLSNLDGEIFSGGNLVIAGRADGTRVERLDNISGRIQAEQGLWLDASNVVNQRRVLQTEHRLYVGQEQFDDPDARSSVTNSVPYELRDGLCPDDFRTRCMKFEGYTTHENKVLEGTRVVLASAASQLLSGGAMQLDVGRLDNIYSNIAAAGDLGINGRQVTDLSDPTEWSGVINNVTLAGYKIIQQESTAEVEYQTCGMNVNCDYEPSLATVKLGSSTARKDYTLPEGAATITAGGGLTIIGGAINNTIVQASGGLGGVTTAPVSNIGNADLGSGTDHQAGGAAAVGSTASNAVNGGPGVQSSAGGQAQAGSNIQASLGDNVQSGAGVGAVDTNGVSGAGGVQTITRNNVAAGNDVQAADDGSTRVRDGVDRMAGSGVQSRDGVQETTGAGATAGAGVQASVGGHATSVRGPDSSQATKVLAGGNAAGVSGGTAAAGAGPDGAAPQFVGTTERPLPGLVPADNGMFKRSADPNSPFLVSTAPRFVPSDTTGSEYLLGKLGSPDDLHKRLGDAYYEQRLVQDQLLALTGRQRLQGEDGLGQYRMLMDNAAQVADALGLNLGSALTGAQIGALDHDIVWLVEQEVDGQKVLVPVVYLSKATAERLRQGGALIEGDTLYAKASGPLNNDGTLAASKGMWLGADTLINSGSLSAGERLSISTAADTVNRGAISAGQVSIDAGRDFVQDASGSLVGTGTVVVEAGRNIALQSTNVVAGGSLGLAAGNDLQIERSNVSAMDNLSLAAGNDLGIAVSKVQAGGDLSAVAGRNIDVTAQTTQETVVSGTRKKTVATVETLQSSSLQAGGSLALQAGQDITLQAADLRAGETMALAAGRDLNLTTVTTTDTSVTQESRKRYSKRSESLDETVHGTTLSAGGDIALVAGRDVTLTAAQVASDEGGIGISAGRDVKLLAEQEQHDLTIDEQRKKKGFLKSKTTTTHDEWHDSIAVTTTLSGETVSIAAGNDLTLQGAQVIGDGNVGLFAGNNVVIESALDTHQETHDFKQKKSGLTGGLSGGVASIGYGKSSSTTQSTLESSTQVASAVGSISGNVTVSAGNQLTIAASDLAAGQDLTLAGKDINLIARQDTLDTQNRASSKSSGFSVGVTYDPGKAYRSARDSTTDGMADSGSTMGKVTRTAEGVASGLRAATTSVVVTAGSQRSNSNRSDSTSDARVSQLSAGGDLTLVAKGGSIYSQGAQMAAEGDALLLATKDIVFDVAHNTENSDSNSRGKGWGMANNTSGLPFGTNNSRGEGTGSSDTITGTQLSVGGGVRMATSEGDIRLTAANVVAEKDVNIHAARDLSISSGQDTVGNANTSESKAIGTVQISDTEKFSGWHRQQHADESGQVSQVASNVGSLGGNVNLSAGGTYSQVASNVVADQDINITAAKIELLTADEVGHYSQSDDDLKIGVFARVKSPLIDLINNVDGARQSDGRLSQMQGMAAAASAYQSASAIANAAGVGGSGSLFSAEAGVGFKSSSSSAEGNSVVSQGSTLQAGGNLNLTSTSGDIHVVQGNLSAGNTISLDSARDILLEAGRTHLQDKSKSSNAGAEVGVGVTVGAQTGVYVYAEASVGSSKSNSDSATWQNTTLSGQNISLKAHGDTTLRGATATADRIDVQTGGTLNIESLQDTAESMSKNSQVGGRVQVAWGNAWGVDGYASGGKSNGNYQGVGEQSGLFAGEGGYHVEAGHVNLVGGAIASTNAGKSELTAQTLTFRDLQNGMEHKTSSGSISGGYGGRVEGWTPVAEGAAPSFGGGVPMNEKGGDNSTTYATLTEGNIVIGGKQTTAAELGVNADAAAAHRALEALPNADKLLADQQIMAGAMGAVMSASKQVANDIANQAMRNLENDYVAGLGDEEKARFEGLSAGEKNLELAHNRGIEFEAALDQRNKWAPGTDRSRALEAVTTLLVGGLSGQGGGQIAANALAPFAANLIGEKFDGHHGSDPNVALQVLSHALLGALLAEANGGAAVNGALAAGGGELAAKYLGDYFTSQNGGRLTLEQEQQVKALGQAVGAVAGGVGGAGIVGAALGTGIATNSVENNFLGKDDLARLRNLRNKAKSPGSMSSQEWTELLLLDTADQMSAGLLRLVQAGAELTEVQQADLYTFYQRYVAQNGSFDIDNLQGITPDTVYGFPYAGLSEDRRAYKEAHFTIWDDIVPLWRERTDNEKIYETAQRWSGLVPNQPQDLLPSTMQWREFFGLHDALTSSALASAGYVTAHFAGASEENKRAIAQTIANIAAIGGTLQAGKTGLLPVTGSLGVPSKPGAIEESPQTNALVVPPSSQNNPKNQQNAKPPTVAEDGIPASSSVARDKLHEHLAEQAGIPRDLVDKPYSIWGKTIDQIRQSFTMDGAMVTSVPPKASSSGNAQVYEIEGSASGIVKIQYSPAFQESKHKGEYYKIYYSDGTKVKIVDPKSYRPQYLGGHPIYDKNTTYFNPQGQKVVFDSATNLWVPK